MIFDRLLESLNALIRAATSRIDYLGLYRCRVVSQNTDGTLELQPDDARLPSLSGVRVFSGVAGASVTVDPGAYVLVGFSNGKPSQPFAALWEPGTATIVFNGGTKQVAVDGDAVALGTFSVVGGVLNWLPPGSSPDAPPQTGVVAATGAVSIPANTRNVKA